MHGEAVVEGDVRVFGKSKDGGGARQFVLSLVQTADGQRIRAHALACFLALIQLRLLRMQLKASNRQESPGRLLEQLLRIQHQTAQTGEGQPLRGLTEARSRRIAAPTAANQQLMCPKCRTRPRARHQPHRAAHAAAARHLNFSPPRNDSGPATVPQRLCGRFRRPAYQTAGHRPAGA